MPFLKLQLIPALALLVCVCSCKSDDERFWDSFEVNKTSNSFAFAFTSSTIAFAGDYVSPIINRIKNNQVPSIDSKNLAVLSLYTSETDPFYNPKAQELLFEYNESGNNTFDNYPAFVSNAKMFNFDTTAFYQSIVTQSTASPVLNVGTLIKAKQGVLSFYVKIKYNAAYSKSHSVVIYLYEKEKIDEQETSAGSKPSFTHRNVFMNYVGASLFGDKISESFQTDQVGQHSFSYELPDFPLKNLGIVTVVYELNSNGKPIAVLNTAIN